MASQVQDSLKGQFLIAMPSLADPNFFQTVTCISEHNDKGAMGVVINRHHEFLTAREIFAELKIDCRPEAAAMPLHVGGPVHTDEIFILHGPPLVWEGSLGISPTLALSNSIDLLRAVATGSGPEAVLLCLGCAGWAPGQIEAEIRQNAWLTGPVDPQILFDLDVGRRWEAAVQGLGIDPALLSAAAGHA